jgi:hypothetical protein
LFKYLINSLNKHIHIYERERERERDRGRERERQRERERDGERYAIPSILCYNKNANVNKLYFWYIYTTLTPRLMKIVYFTLASD